MIYHFILTRFALRLWSKDKKGNDIDWRKWLEERLELFETYCLPSMMSQSCQEFAWIMLVDRSLKENNPTINAKLAKYKEKCPQIHYIWVNGNAGWKFAEIFQQVVAKKIDTNFNGSDLCLTTYLDNDDRLNKDYVKEVRNIAEQRNNENNVWCDVVSKNPYFIVFDYGKQYFTELDLTTRIKYPNNHFMTYVESCYDIRTCYGFGSHFLLEKNHLADVFHVKDKTKLFWTEVIHNDNVDNDVKMTLDTKILMGSFTHRCQFCIRTIQQIARRMHDKVIPRKW